MRFLLCYCGFDWLGFARILWLAVALLPPARSSAAQASAAAREYCAAQTGYRYEFPRDHFSHPCFRTEWWYFTGNLATADGRRFGYQLTFFREGVDNPYWNPSRWRVDELYLAHFALSDLQAREFVYAQRISRAGIGLAGADPAGGRIWNGHWSAKVSGDRWNLWAVDGDSQIRLNLRSLKPPAIQGVDGVSRKGAGAGNASHYYSLTRLETSGQLRVRGRTFEVTGWSWMDHEFSTSQLEPGQIGWDWISLQMEDGTEWMLFELRRADGSRDPHSAGSYVDEQGRVWHLSAAEFEMIPLEEWTSPATGARYPVRWRIRAPRFGLDAEVAAAMPNQELDTRPTTQIIYWEGSVAATGSRNGKAVRGRGYLEMTGYAGPLPAGLYAGENER